MAEDIGAATIRLKTFKLAWDEGRVVRYSGYDIANATINEFNALGIKPRGRQPEPKRL